MKNLGKSSFFKKGPRKKGSPISQEDAKTMRETVTNKKVREQIRKLREQRKKRGK